MPTFTYQGYNLHYHTIGNGPKYLLAFHGYGNLGNLFDVFENSLGRQYTILSFDLFHHGESAYPDNIPPSAPLGPAFILEMLEALLAEHNIATFGLMGYSMGGRLSLFLAPLFGDRVTELYLFAPDGIKRSPGYMLGTYTVIGRALFRLMVRYGGIINYVLRLGKWLKIVDPKAYTFFLTQVSTRQKREKLYNSWQAYRNFKPDLDTVAGRIRSGKLQLHLFTGRFDKVLPYYTANRLVKKVGGDAKNNVLESGHDLVSAKTSLFLQKYLGL